MKTKIVYIVTSTPEDIYLEQTFLSICSLREVMPSAVVELVVDNKTDKTLVGKRKEILKYIDNKIVVDVPSVYNKVETSRYIKTSLRKYISGDFLFIDSDTIITDSLDDIDLFEGAIGVALNLHIPLKLHDARNIQILLKRMSDIGYEGDDSIPYYNSGVMFVRECEKSREFYDLWHKKWKEAVKISHTHKDQVPLAVANYELGLPIKELSGNWNCQILANGLPFLHTSKIIHYFASFSDNKTDRPYLFSDNHLCSEIKECGQLTEEALALIKNAKSAFVTPCRIVSGNEMRLLSDDLHQLAIYHPKIYALFKKMSTYSLSIFRELKSVVH